MKVGFAIRGDYLTNPGGDTIQAQKTAAELERLGAKIDWIGGRHALHAAKECELIHIFNLTRLTDSYSIAASASKAGVPYVLSPIWHSLRDMRDFYGSYYGVGSAMFPIRTYLALKELMYERRGLDVSTLRACCLWGNSQRSVVMGAAQVLANSPEELATMEKDLGVSIRQSTIVRNGVDLAVGGLSGVRKEKILVCSGRIEPRKNTLSVIRGFLASGLVGDYRLVLVGNQSLLHRRYVDQVMGLVDGSRVVWIGYQPLVEVQRLYASAECLILASFFETTGLVGLEALHAGTKVVMTRRSYSSFYYGDRVVYCDPFDEQSIAAALEQAVHCKLPDVPGEWFEKFSWRAIGEETCGAYAKVLGRKGDDAADVRGAA